MKPVSFSLNDKYDSELLEFVEGKDFSKYVKRLILVDKLMNGNVENMTIIFKKKNDDENYTIDL
ncbi:hypothetical protein D1B33_07385 [Lysinibacillus yapensis]|uniref:Uncharacterized protein n=1 Tax=Ureibacillus yapensis TaxID=2304605 RepID=A0A396SRE7_9BACL|nr:hypothetical protein D1B33_07385 [Lysinibacillus yapensis]